MRHFCTLKIHKCLDRLLHVSETSVILDQHPRMASLVCGLCFLVFSAAGRSSHQVGRSMLCWICYAPRRSASSRDQITSVISERSFRLQLTKSITVYYCLVFITKIRTLLHQDTFKWHKNRIKVPKLNSFLHYKICQWGQKNKTQSETKYFLFSFFSEPMGIYILL